MPTRFVKREISDLTQAKGVQMKVEILDEPIRFHLHGIGGVVENEQYGEVGLRLMDEMWQVVKAAKTPTTGINHWVYLPDGKMFVGAELRNPPQAPLPDQLEPLEFELQRSSGSSVGRTPSFRLETSWSLRH